MLKIKKLKRVETWKCGKVSKTRNYMKCKKLSKKQEESWKHVFCPFKNLSEWNATKCRKNTSQEWETIRQTYIKDEMRLQKFRQSFVKSESLWLTWLCSGWLSILLRQHPTAVSCTITVEIEFDPTYLKVCLTEGFNQPPPPPQRPPSAPPRQQRHPRAKNIIYQ